MKKPIIIALVGLVFIVVAVFVLQTSRSSGRTVAIATLMSHLALDEVQEGMLEELASRGWRDGERVTFVIRNANQQMQLVPTIASDLAAQDADVTVAITTPMAQAIARVARGPLVFAAVTDPVGAGLVPDLENGHGQVTGTSDAWPYRAQLELIREILPKARMLGVLYNPGEAASQYGIRRIRANARSLNFELIEAGVNTVNEVRPVAENLAGRVDALFLSSDNTVIGGMAGALSVATERRLPLFVGDSGTVERGGIAAVSVGYRELGRRTGELVDRFLNGERDIPPFVAQGVEVHVNRKAAELMAVELPRSVLDRAARVYTEISR